LATALGACGRIGFAPATSSAGDAADVRDGSNVSDAAISVALVSDDFGRSVGSGWGNADIGGAWFFYTVDNCTADVGGGYGNMTLSGTTAYADLHVSGTTARDTETRVTARFDQLPATGSYAIGVKGRWVRSVSSYWVQADVLASGAVNVSILSQATSTINTLATGTFGSSIGPNTDLTLSIIASGASPTTLCGRVWLASSPEPTACTVMAMDSTPQYQVPGISYLFANENDSTTPTVSFSTFRFTRIGPQ
jgi:hypothetical protein